MTTEHDNWASEQSAAQTLASLKSLKNAIVGNPKAKANIVNEESIQWMLGWLVEVEVNPEDGHEEIVQSVKLEVARVISILAHANMQATLQLVRAHVIDAILLAIAHMPTPRRRDLEAALTNALRSVVSSCSSILGNIDWGLYEDFTITEREDARKAIERIFQPDAMGAYLPILAQDSEASTTVASLLESGLSCWDTLGPRRVVIDWTPENVSRSPLSPVRNSSVSLEQMAIRSRLLGGVVVSRLVYILANRTRDRKAQEASLLALAALATENPGLSATLMLPQGENASSAFIQVFELTASRYPTLQFAAMLCAIRILRAPKEVVPSHIIRPNRTSFDPILTLALLLKDTIANSSLENEVRAKFCFLFAIFMADDPKIQEVSSRCGALSILVRILDENRKSNRNHEYDEEVPKSVYRLREGAFRALASSTLTLDSNRRELLNMTPSYIALISESLEDPNTGVRWAGCQCARALSRSVEVLRTSAIDSGLGMKIWDRLKVESDKRVQIVLLMCMGNIVMDFSPLRESLFEKGVMQRVVEFINTDDDELRFNAAWAIRNTLYRADFSNYKLVFDLLSMDRFFELLTDRSSKVRQQAIILARNTATSETSCQYMIDGLGMEKIFLALGSGINEQDDHTAFHAIAALDNIARYTDCRSFLEQANLLASFKARLKSNSSQSVKRAVLSTLLTLAKSSDHSAKVLKQDGFDSVVADLIRNSEVGGGHGDIPAETASLRDLARSVQQALSR